MRRVWVVMMMSSLLLAATGCGRKSYEDRLAATLAQLEYTRRLNKNLMPPPSDKKFNELAIFVRPPKDEAPSTIGQLPVTEGQFDLHATFADPKADTFLHLLARVKMPKKAPAKGAPPPPPPVQRGDFTSDVLGALSNLFGSSEGLETPKFSDESKRGNRFRRLIFTASEKEVKLFTFKQDNHEVALVFVYPPSQRAAMASKIDLCLESFATGPKATRLYSGGEPEEDSNAGPAVPL